MPLRDRYLFAELILPFVTGALAVLMMLVGNTLYQLLEQMITEKWPVAFVLRVLILNIPTVLVITLPVATALAVSLSVTRLARDNEIAVLRGVGLSLDRIFLPIAIFGLLTSALSLGIADRVVPWAWRAQQDAESLLASLPTSAIDAKQTFFFESMTVTLRTAKKLPTGGFRAGDVTVVDRGVEPGELPRLTRAKTADYGSGRWLLRDVAVHEFAPDGTTRFDARARSGTLALTIDAAQGGFGLPGGQQTNLSFAELSTRAGDAARRNDPGLREWETARWFKLALPLLCLPLALLCAPLALRFSKAGSFAGVLLSIIVVFVGANLLFSLQYLAQRGTLPALPAAFLPHLILGGTALFLTRRIR
jgi:lipopolysaccharide export LptBFGC system permease protein LptF